MEGAVEVVQDLALSDVEFCDIYFKALCSLLDIHNSNHSKHLRRYFELLRTKANASCEFFRNPGDEDFDMIDQLMDSLYYRLAYVYRNSTLLSSAVAFHLKNILEDNPTILDGLLRKKKIRICSIGGGPAADVVAIVMLLDSAAEKKGVDLDIRVTVIDIDVKWKNTCIGVLRCLPRFSSATWKIKFLQADLSKFHTLEAVGAIQSADFVTLVKFSSEFMRGHLNCTDTIKEITNIVQPGCLLFFLDRLKKDLIKTCGGHRGEFQNFQLVYEEVCDLHTLHTAAVERNYCLYDKHFGANVFNTCLKVFVRAWVKSIAIERENRLNVFEQSLFRQKVKFDAIQSLSMESFEKWKNRFTASMRKIGWNKNGIETYVNYQQEMMEGLNVELVKKMKSVESARNELLEEFHMQTGRVGERNWIRYLVAKRDLAFIKRNIHCEVVINLRGYLKHKNF